MSTQSQRVFKGRSRPILKPPMRDPRLLGRILVDMGAITEDNVRDALDMQQRMDAQLGDIFIAEGMARPDQVQKALAQQHGLAVADLAANPPEPGLANLISAELCLKHSAVPWMQIGSILLVATAHPDQFAALKEECAQDDLAVLPALALEEDIRVAIETVHGPELADRAETRVAPHLSCRTMSGNVWRRAALAGFLVTSLIWALVLVPWVTVSALSILAVVTLGLTTVLKLASGGTQLVAEWRAPFGPKAEVTPLRLPRVSVMVPLLHEKEIANVLIRRLSELSYPKALLDVVLVLEAEDQITRETLSRTTLPPWMRVIAVPKGSGLTTKPRALNYALDFCKADIIGIWDAEDAPETDQIEVVVTHFHSAPDDVVCLQGKLDYYNPKDNWIARCFSIEYAAWWRLVMPGLVRLGMVIPLGGTTLFFKRKPLEDLGGWDAHNVTEDADLGLRLARAGYRTELINTVTYEEANCRAWPWIRQRSRWLKGFALTWAVHMRNPVQLWRDLGTYRFIGVQAFYIAALSQFLLAPVFWGFWLILFGFASPFGDWLGTWGMLGFFLTCEAVNIGLHLFAVRRPQHRHLMKWTPIMSIYFIMACVGIYKAMYELIGQPFFWDKTQHGVSTPETFQGPPNIPVFISRRSISHSADSDIKLYRLGEKRDKNDPSDDVTRLRLALLHPGADGS